MKSKDVLVLGAGIAGCAVALALAKRGVPVSILPTPSDVRFSPFIKYESLESKLDHLENNRDENLCCSRAYEQFATLAKKGMEELLNPYVLIDRDGNLDIHRALVDQLKQHAEVEWLADQTIIELLTLDQHSAKKADCYKKPTCTGVATYNRESQQIEYHFAKETILALGGAAALYPYSTTYSDTGGTGLSIAHRAGARILNIDQIKIHPLGLFNFDRPSLPLPLELLEHGGKLLSLTSQTIEGDPFDPNLSNQLNEILLKTKSDYLWLDLTAVEVAVIKEKFLHVESHCLNYGYNLFKSPLPIVPIVTASLGGIAIDRVGQTTLQRLRAIGEGACSGLHWNELEPSLAIIEELTWAVACAEDLAKQIPKLVYYFPDPKEIPIRNKENRLTLEEDWRLLRQILWNYFGIKKDAPHVERGSALLNSLFQSYACGYDQGSIEQIQFFHALQSAQLIAQAAKKRLSVDVINPCPALGR